MSGQWQQPIARIQRGDVVIGTGVVVQTEQDGSALLTCAHVVNEFMGRSPYAEARPGEELELTFTLPSVSGSKLFSSSILEWFPPRTGLARTDQPVSDVALLKVESKLPGDRRVVKPDHFKVRDLGGTRVTGFGFSEDNGSFAFGELLGKDAGGWLNFAAKDDLRKFIEPGFSGAPLFDENRSVIVGMVVALDEGTGRVAYAQPTENLWRACPQIAKPYKGLRDFEETDARFFFGRDRFVDELTAKAAAYPIIGVSAPSGAGKSSTVKAGLIPKLRIDGRHHILKMRPGADPWKALARELAALIHPHMTEPERIDIHEKIVSKIKSPDRKESAEALRDYVRAALAGDGFADRIFIYVDQFEELFTLAGHKNSQHDLTVGDKSQSAGGSKENLPVEKPDFRDLMAETATLDGDPKIQWCYSIRADFTGKLIPHRAFIDRLGDGEIKLSEMTAQEMRMAIWRPAKELQVQFEVDAETQEDLSDQLADDAGKNAGSLPLLEHVLEQLWNRLSDRTVTRAAYDELGGLGGALDKYAEGIAEKHFPGERRMLLRRLFFRLVEPGEASGATRRIVSREELGDEELWESAKTLADARLVVIRGGEGRPDTAEVAHEALLIHWRSLHDWIIENRDFMKWAKAFRVDYDRWVENGRSSEFLLKGGALAAASRRLEEWADFLNPGEREFIKGSSELLAQEDAAKRRQVQRVRTLTILFVVFLAVVTAVAVWGAAAYQRNAANAAISEAHAILQAERAEAERARAEQEKAAAEVAREKADTDKSVYATAVAGRLVEQGDYLQALLVLRDVLPRMISDDLRIRKEIAFVGLAGAYQAMHENPAILRGHGSPLSGAAFSPDGSRIVTVSDDDAARLWDTRSGREIAILKGHKSLLNQATFSPDGSRIVTASYDDTARLWDAWSGRETFVLEGHLSTVYYAAFSPDGSRIVTASADRTARLWDVQTGREIAILRGHERAVEQAVFSPDGSRIVTASDDKTARLWDVQSGREIAILRGHERTVNQVAFSPDGSRIVTASADRTARLWDVQTGREIAILKGHEDAVKWAVFSPDGSRIVTASADKTARLWDVQSGREIAVLEGHQSTVNQAAFSPDGSRIATASDDMTARLWDAQSGRRIEVLKGYEIAIKQAVFSPDGSRIVTASYADTARLWDAWSGREIVALEGHQHTVNHAAFSPDGSHIVTASDDDTARLWDVQSGREIAVLKGHEGGVNQAAFSPDGSRIATASDDMTARLWDVQSGREIAVLKGHGGGVNQAVFSRDGSRIATASDDMTARLWDVESGREIAVLKGHEGGVNQVVFSPDGSRVVTASSDAVWLWDAQSGREIPVMEQHLNVINQIALSPDGSRIVTVSDDKTARLWDVQSGHEIAVLKGHGGAVNQAVFSPDGSRIVTASYDNTARLWDAQSGREIAVLKGHGGAVNQAVFSPDGSRIVTVSEDGTARLWNVAPVELLDHDRIALSPPISQTLLDIVFTRYPTQLTCDDRRRILKEDKCQ